MGSARRKTQQAAIEVSGVDMKKLSHTVKWSGVMNLHLTKEHEPCFISEWEWPLKSGKIWYACASTGLLFDKTTGVCRQSVHLSLDLPSLNSEHITSRQLRAWVRVRQDQSYDWSTLKLRRGPKPKSYVANEDVDSELYEEA